MPLLPDTLAEDLEATFADPPATRAACAQAWADAVQAYAAGIVPASTAVTSAAATLSTALAGAFATVADPYAGPAMETAFAAFAVSVGGAMAGYTPTPPAGAVGFVAQFAGAAPETHADAADAIAGLIHDWLTTGSSTLIASPFTVVPWS